MLAHVFTFLRKHNTVGELNFAAFALFIGLSEDALGNLYYFAKFSFPRMLENLVSQSLVLWWSFAALISRK